MRSRIAEERRIVEQMIHLYCRHKEGNLELCDSCHALLQYAHGRLSLCPFGNKKSTCKRCEIHCYKPEMRKQMQKVMRYSGPRMIFYHPWAALYHLWREL